MRQQPGMVAEDVLLAVTTLSFDIAGLELFLPLTVGARVVIVSRSVAADGHQLAGRLGETQATVMQATPATWRLLLAAGWAGQARLKMLCGGEALPWELARSLLSRGAALWNMYGPTETTIWSAIAHVEEGQGTVSLGRPIANTEFYVLDRFQQPVPVGVPGELYIGGAGVARGYLHRPELTAERFVAHPWSDRPGARLYRTGDLVCYRQDGGLDFLGRIDQQVKMRGFRIELEEIAAVLREHPAVREAVAIVRDDTPGDQRLVSYFVTQDAPPPSSVVLRDFLRQRLPDYMVPAALVRLEALPLTPNGKIDRRALPAPERLGHPAEDPAPGPGTPLEALLSEIWQDVLKVEGVHISDNFFDLGGHSLSSLQVIARVEESIGVRLSVAELMYQTLGQLASCCEERLRHGQQTEPLGFTQRVFHALKRRLSQRANVPH
jgi:acyl-coenzyme A synthetase/AMP-(fatty) acid ligase/acyl carrier protein